MSEEHKDAEEEGGEDEKEAKPEKEKTAKPDPKDKDLPLVKNQVWQGSDGDTRLVRAFSNEGGIDKVTFESDAKGKNPPKAETVPVEEFNKWRKKCLGIIG